MKIKFLRKNAKTLLFAIMLTLFSCQDDTNELQSESIQISSAKEWFRNYKYKEKFDPIFKDVDFRWQLASEIKLEDGSFAIGVPIHDVPENPDYEGEKMMYLYPDGENYIAVIHELLPESNTVHKDYNVKSKFENLDYYTGYIITWDLVDGFIKGAQFENGIFVNNVQARIPKRSSEAGKVAPIINLDEVIVRGGSAPSNPIAIKKDFSISGGFSGNNGSGTGGYINSPGTGGGKTSGSTTPKKYANIIDLLTGKAKCLNGLLTKDGNDYVLSLLGKFKGNSEFDIQIVSKDIVISPNSGLEINGSTEGPVNNFIVINISNSMINSTSALDGVRTILHEYIHADMFGKLYTINDKKSKEVLDFKKTYEEYGKSQHSAMGVLYIESMKEALKDFHLNVLPNDYAAYTRYYGEAPSDAFYEALAWSGLKDVDVKAWTDLPATKRALIEKLAKRAILLGKTTPCSN